MIPVGFFCATKVRITISGQAFFGQLSQNQTVSGHSELFLLNVKMLYAFSASVLTHLQIHSIHSTGLDEISIFWLSSTLTHGNI